MYDYGNDKRLDYNMFYQMIFTGFIFFSIGPSYVIKSPFIIQKSQVMILIEIVSRSRGLFLSINRPTDSNVGRVPVVKRIPAGYGDIGARAIFDANHLLLKGHNAVQVDQVAARKI